MVLLKDGQTYGKYKCIYASNGLVSITDSMTPQQQASSIALKPEYVSGKTRASLVLVEEILGDFDKTFHMRTRAANRTPKPNNWEVAWFMWHFTDMPAQVGRTYDTHHHYYFYVGWDGMIEVGRKEGLHPHKKWIGHSGWKNIY